MARKPANTRSSARSLDLQSKIPPEWWEGFVKACQRLKERFPAEFGAIAGIGICGQMHTQVYLDQHDRSLRPAITWMDQRSSAIVERIQQDPEGRELIFRETSNFASTTYTAPQVRWVMENQPEVWAQTASILIAKDYLKYLLTGEKAIDYAEASGTLLFNVAKEAWSDEAFQAISRSRAAFFPQAAALRSDHRHGQQDCRRGHRHPSRHTGRQRQLG